MFAMRYPAKTAIKIVIKREATAKEKEPEMK